ncbi:hypothetical protein LCGC14_0174290 [marine sediment metagenome]|uniref:Uncharacterized protein n=1 Tax=marine sediment metagenome TaxID=412755 RepID=A0A0F9X9A8_9ZZZZ
MFKYRITKTSISTNVEEFEVIAPSDMVAESLAAEYENDIEGKIKLVGGYDDSIGNCDIVVDSVEEYPRIKKKKD